MEHSIFKVITVLNYGQTSTAHENCGNTFFIDKDGNQSMKRNVTSNHIPIQHWCCSTYQSTHCITYVILWNFKDMTNEHTIESMAPVTAPGLEYVESYMLIRFRIIWCKSCT